MLRNTQSPLVKISTGQSNIRSVSGVSAMGESQTARWRMQEMAKQKRDLLVKIQQQKVRNAALKQQIDRDYQEYSSKVSEATKEVSLLKAKYQQYELQIQEMALKIQKMGL